jgi:hypothetical protein
MWQITTDDEDIGTFIVRANGIKEALENAELRIDLARYESEDDTSYLWVHILKAEKIGEIFNPFLTNDR